MSDGKWWYIYDANGNRTSRARTATRNENTVTLDKTGEYWEYTWDYHNRLVKVQQFNAPDNAQNVKVEYTYDAMNRGFERVSYTGETSVKTQYAYGRNCAITYQKKTAGSSVTTRSFVYLNNQIAVFMNIENGTESIRYAITDIQGSVTEVYDKDNKLVWKSGYTAFGIKAGETINLIDFDGLYTDCDYDVETGLTYHWNRWRSEDGSFWLSQDPIRDGMNWYAYCNGTPINYIDPNGLSATGAVLGWIGADVAIPEPTDLIPLKWVSYGAAITGAAIIDHLAVKSISKAIEKARTKEDPKNYVYHMTGSMEFSKKVQKNGVSEIDPDYGPGTSRFGNKFYVAGDKVTSHMEATNPGIMLKFSMSEDANILDLTNPDVAKKMGYTMGLTHEESQKLMKGWDLSGVDAIKYPSEKKSCGC